MRCPYCGKETEAAVCPKCYAQILNNKKKEQKQMEEGKVK